MDTNISRDGIEKITVSVQLLLDRYSKKTQHTTIITVSLTRCIQLNKGGARGRKHFCHAAKKNL